MGVLDRWPFSLPGAAVIAAWSYYQARRFASPSYTFAEHIHATRWLSRLLVFVALKATNRVLNRLVRNHGWRADPPKWSFVKGEGDVILITGGSGGIGAEMVEILARKTDKIAVLDMSPPLYSASAASEWAAQRKSPSSLLITCASENVKYYKCDVTDPAQIAEVAKRVRADVSP